MRLIVRGRQVVARMPRLLKTGVLVALLAVFTLGSVSAIGVGRFAVPTAHAAYSCSPIAYHEQIPDLTPAGMSGDAQVILNVYYEFDPSTETYGPYCGYMTVQATATLYPGSHGGYLWGGLYNCAGQYQTGTNVLLMSGNGTISDTYFFHTSVSAQVYQNCGFGAVEAWSYPSKGVKAYTQATTGDITSM